MPRTLVFSLAFLLSFSLPSGSGWADQNSQTAEKLFRSRCSSCHVIPDPTFKTDRAWIRQLQFTA